LVEAHALAEKISSASTNNIDDASPVAAEYLKSEISRNGQPSSEDFTKMRSMEANSGIAFTRLLGQRLDPSSGPKLFTFGWNLGSHYYTPPAMPSVTDILDQESMHSLAGFYFANVHPIYGFLKKTWIMKNIPLRWSRPEACEVPDHVLCGVAAVGILFSDTNHDTILNRLVEAQKKALESTSTMLPPCLSDVQSWVLRCLILRVTDHPHATWLATCTTMHLVESVGLQLEASSFVLHPAANDLSSDPELRRRTFWVARMLNSWVSFEYGRTRVALRGITANLPTSDDGDFTTHYIDLYSISCCLDPEQSDKAGEWEDFLERLDAYDPKHDGIALSKANLGLCGYRRLRLANPNLSPDAIAKIIKIGLDGLAAARRMAAQGMPWWHVANVPFQVICVFLAMDGRESLSHLSTAMRTLEFVVDRFRTTAMKEALKTARFLIRLSKKRKDEDSEVLSLTLQKDVPDLVEVPMAGGAPLNVDNIARRVVATQQPPAMVMNGVTAGNLMSGNVNVQPHGNANGNLAGQTPKTASSEDWNLDVLNDSQFDW
jgi:hypothetical protein